MNSTINVDEWKLKKKKCPESYRVEITVQKLTDEQVLTE